MMAVHGGAPARRVAFRHALRIAVLAAVFACLSTPALAQRMVFAHYMVTNQDYQGNSDPTQEAKITAYEREIQQAQAAGIDGFALNVGGWLNQNYYIIYSAQMFEAAARLNTGFKLMFSADMCCGNAMADVEDMVRRFANDARYSQVYFKYNGEFVLTTFSGDAMGTAFWSQVKSDLAGGSNPSTTTEPAALAEVAGAPSNAPVHVFLVPAFFWGGEIPTTAAVQQGFNQWSPVIDGSFYWGIAGVPGSGGSLDPVTSSESYASVVHGGGKLYMAPVCLQFWGANADRYFEYSGAAGMRKMWMDAINVTHPDWVEIITWNDFTEGSYVSPIDDPNKYQFANFLDTTGVPSTTLGYFHSHNGATALLPYFINWYKTGVQPTISNDAIYWFYRTQSQSSNPGVPTVSAATNYGPVADVVYVTVNLTAPGVLKVTSGSRVSTFNLPAGSSDVQAPFMAGSAPTFELDRGSSVSIAAVAGTDTIQAAPQFNDYYYSTGSATGAAGSSSGQPPTAASVPTGLTAQGGVNRVTLSWTASASGTAPITYSVFRGATSGGEAATAIATGLSGTTFTDTGLATGGPYYYEVAASNATGTTAHSTEATARTLSPVLQIDAGGGPVAPFIADAGFNTGNEFSSSANIDVAGVNAPAPQAVYRSVRWAPSFYYSLLNLTPGASYVVRLHFAELSFTGPGQRVFNVAINGTNVLSNFDVFAAAGAQNKAVVREFPIVGSSNGSLSIAFSRGPVDNPEIAAIEIYSATSSSGTAGGTPVPVAPTGLSATAGNGQVALSWTASAGATSYSVYRSTSSGGEGMSSIAAGISSTAFTDTGLANGTSYFYKVAAVNSAGVSVQSAEVAAKPVGATPSGLPDLIVSSLTWVPANPQPGDHVVLTVVVTNQGTQATAAGTVLGVGFDFDGSQAATVWEDTDTASLAPGASVTLTATNGTAGVNYWIATAGSHSVTAWVDDVNRIAESNENNNKLTETVTVNAASSLTPVAQIDAGSGGGVAPFAADVDFNTGNEFSTGAGIDLSAAANAAPAGVYQSCRWAPSFSYTIPGLTVGSRYTVRLHFAELTWSAPGQRVFNVAINGINVLSGFDIFAAAGARDKAVVEQFTAVANTAGQLVISFTQSGADNPQINGIEILH